MKNPLSSFQKNALNPAAKELLEAAGKLGLRARQSMPGKLLGRYADLLKGGFGGSLEKLRMRAAAPDSFGDFMDTFTFSGKPDGALGELIKNEEKKVLLTRLVTGGAVGGQGLRSLLSEGESKEAAEEPESVEEEPMKMVPVETVETVDLFASAEKRAMTGGQVPSIWEHDNQGIAPFSNEMMPPEDPGPPPPDWDILSPEPSMGPEEEEFNLNFGNTVVNPPKLDKINDFEYRQRGYDRATTGLRG